MTDDEKLMSETLEALVIAEAGLADIGDADREPGDDLAWCEARAAQALAIPRQAIAALQKRLAQPTAATVADNSQNWRGMDGATAWHLIHRHADGWSDVTTMMSEWLAANQPEQ